MQKLANKDSNDSKCGTIIDNILDVGLMLFACSCYLVNRKNNVIVARVAKFAADLKSNVLWEDTFPM